MLIDWSRGWSFAKWFFGCASPVLFTGHTLLDPDIHMPYISGWFELCRRTIFRCGTQRFNRLGKGEFGHYSCLEFVSNCASCFVVSTAYHQKNESLGTVVEWYRTCLWQRCLTFWLIRIHLWYSPSSARNCAIRVVTCRTRYFVRWPKIVESYD